MNDSEVWKDVAGYEGLYQISNKGNVYSVERMVQGRKRGGITLKPKDRRDGYLQVGLYKNGKMKNKLIHRLVLEAFVENPNNLPEVNHKDENKINNDLSNLEWCTGRHNLNYGTRNKRISQKLSKKVRAVNIESGEVLVYSSATEAGNKGFAIGHVSSACRGVYYGGNLYRNHNWSYE